MYRSIVLVEQRHIRARSRFVSSGSKSARMGKGTICATYVFVFEAKALYP